MRNILTLSLCVLLGVLSAHAYQIVAGEYFIDSDPGIGNATPFSVLPGDSAEIQRGIAMQSLPSGVHTLFIRYRDVTGVWSSTVGKPFSVIPADLSQPTPLTSGEYFFDADPGMGQGQPITFAESDSVELQLATPTNGLSAGVHSLSVRYNASGLWSRSTGKPFSVLPVQPPQPGSLVTATCTIHGTLVSGAVFDTTFTLSAEDSAFDSTFEATADVILTSYAGGPRTLERGYYTMTIQYEDDLGNDLPEVQVYFEVTSGLVVRAAYPGVNDVSLHWFHSELDNGYYSVYRGNSLGGVYSFIDSTSGNFYTDVNVLIQNGPKFYRVTAQYFGWSIMVEGNRVVPLDPAYAEQ